MYIPGSTFARSFITQTTAGVKQAADFAPTASLRRNGTNDGGVSVTITANGGGDYTASGTIPSSYNDGDAIEIIVVATVGGNSGELIISLDTVTKLLANIISSLAGQELILQSPVGSGAITVVAKDAYLATDGRQLLFTKPAGANWPATLSGWSITFTATITAGNTNSGTSSITASGAVNVATGSTQQVQVELTSALTAGLAAGAGLKGYKFDVVAILGADRATLISGYMTVLSKVTT